MFKVEREVVKMEEWFEAFSVVKYYEKLLDILEQDLNFDDVYEVYYEENVDNNDFKVELIATRQLEGGFRNQISDTELRFYITYFNQSPLKDKEGGKGLYGAVQLDVNTKLVVSMPGEKDNWIHSFLRRIWFNSIYRKQFLYWVELAQEETRRYLNETRAYFGLEPVVRKPRRQRYEPLEHSL